MVGIVVEVCLGHLAARNGQCLLVVDILARLAVLVDEKADAQLFPHVEDGLQGSLEAVEVDVVGQRYDAGDVVLHHLRIFQAVVEDAQL